MSRKPSTTVGQHVQVCAVLSVLAGELSLAPDAAGRRVLLPGAGQVVDDRR